MPRCNTCSLDQLVVVLRGQVAGNRTAAPPTTFVIDPLATPGGNVYATLADVAAVASTIAGSKTISIRGSVSVPDGVYDLGRDPVAFVGSNPTATLAFSSGAVLSGVGDVVFQDLVGPTKAGTAPLITPSLQSITVRFVHCTNIVGQLTRASTPFLVENFLVQGTTTAAAPAGTIFDAVGAGTNAKVFVDSSSSIGANRLAQSGGGSLIATSQSPSASISLTQSGMPGGVLVAGSTYVLSSSTANSVGPGGNSPAFQSGTATLVTGTVTISGVTLTTTSRIVAFIKDSSGTVVNGRLQAPAASRNVGAGTFVVQSFNNATGGVDANDTSTFDWLIIN
jgi:hypothetical protein